MKKEYIKQLERLESKWGSDCYVITTDKKGNKKRWNILDFFSHVCPPWNEEHQKPQVYKKIEYIGDSSKHGKIKEITQGLYNIFVLDKRSDAN